MKTCFFFGLLSALVLSATGCGNGNVGLGGKVTFTDGTPLTVGEIYFETDTFMARGELKEDGTYVVGSVKEGDGIPKGIYRVSIVADKMVPDKAGGMMLPESLVAEKYRHGTTSGLTVEIPVPGNKFDVTVEPYSPKGKK
ncbi:MAG: hypothetical protein LBQ54_02975 [Planctomycetaceae bacterium]|jgi:hypothetical protein|nr:hypothetical protein [Planctomycetaceae bacterium]